LCKQAGLDWADIDSITIGMCLDFIDEYIQSVDPKSRPKVARKATQSDFDRF